MKAIKQLYDSSAAFQRLKPVYDGLQKIKFEKLRAKYKAEHEAELIQMCIRDSIKKKIALLFDWIAEAKAELAKPQAPNLVSLLNAYYTSRRAGAYSQKGKVSNLKEMNETFNYLRANGIYSLEDLESRVSEYSACLLYTSSHSCFFCL